MQKKYKSPLIKMHLLHTFMAMSTLDSSKDDQQVKTDDDEFNGKFRAPKRNLWEEE